MLRIICVSISVFSSPNWMERVLENRGFRKKTRIERKWFVFNGSPSPFSVCVSPFPFPYGLNGFIGNNLLSYIPPPLNIMEKSSIRFNQFLLELWWTCLSSWNLPPLNAGMYFKSWNYGNLVDLSCKKMPLSCWISPRNRIGIFLSNPKMTPFQINYCYP